MSATIRRARPGDAEAVGALVREFQAYLRAIGDDTNFEFRAERFLRDGFGPDAAFEGLVAEDGGEIVGYLLHHAAYDADAGRRTLYVADFYVRADRRRRGIGRALMHEATAVARASGAAALAWVVLEGNDLAFSFYESLGARRLPRLVTMLWPIEPVEGGRSP